MKNLYDINASVELFLKRCETKAAFFLIFLIRCHTSISVNRIVWLFSGKDRTLLILANVMFGKFYGHLISRLGDFIASNVGDSQRDWLFWRKYMMLKKEINTYIIIYALYEWSFVQKQTQKSRAPESKYWRRDPLKPTH